MLFLLLLSSLALYGGVVAKVDAKNVELGDVVTLSLIVSGEDVTRPNVQRVCDSDVISTSTQTNMQIINGSVSKSFTLNYTFMPQKSCKIEPVEIEIDGKVERSNPLEVEVALQSMTKDADFTLTLNSDKKELFVGEPFELTLTFKQKRDSEAVDIKFSPPEFKGFWVKSETQPQRYQDAKESITKIVYTMAPQRAGELKTTKAQIQIASRGGGANSFNTWIPTIKWKSYFSNELTFDVKPLPSGITLAGNFTISATADKEEVDANEPLNVTIDVIGDGNLEDIKSFKPSIEGVAIFDEKISIEKDVLTQKIAFVSERDFVIPSFSIKYFDPKTKETKTALTKEIPIKVKNAKPQEVLNIKKQEAQGMISEDLKAPQIGIFGSLSLFMSGLALGVLIMFFMKKIDFKSKESRSIKDPKTLLMKLLPFRDDEEVKAMIESLEKNIYSNQNIELDKKILRKIKERYKI